MADIAAGDIKSLTAENALLESAMRIQALERTGANNPDGRNFVNVTFNTDAGTATIAATIPITQTVNPDGTIGFLATEYLT